MLHAGPEDNEPEACNKQQNRNSGWYLGVLLFIDGSLDGPDLRNFFLLVVREIRVYQSSYAQD